MIRQTCPYCEGQQNARDNSMGYAITCKTCGRKFIANSRKAKMMPEDEARLDAEKKKEKDRIREERRANKIVKQSHRENRRKEKIRQREISPPSDLMVALKFGAIFGIASAILLLAAKFLLAR